MEEFIANDERITFYGDPKSSEFTPPMGMAGNGPCGNVNRNYIHKLPICCFIVFFVTREESLSRHEFLHHGCLVQSSQKNIEVWAITTPAK